MDIIEIGRLARPTGGLAPVFFWVPILANSDLVESAHCAMVICGFMCGWRSHGNQSAGVVQFGRLRGGMPALVDGFNSVGFPTGHYGQITVHSDSIDMLISGSDEPVQVCLRDVDRPVSPCVG